MFPTQTIDLNAIINAETTASPSSKKTFKFDFASGDFVVKDGKPVEVENIDALEAWIEKILRTEKDKYSIYANGYGATLFDYLTSRFPMAFIKSEVEREVTEVLLQNSDIKSIADFEFSRDKRTLSVSFTVNSIYGTLESEVII